MTLEPTTIFAMSASALVVFFLCVAWTANYIDAAEPKPVEPKIDVARLIDAIAMVENWDGHSVGAAGERGRLQWKEATWEQFGCIGHHEMSLPRSYLDPFDWKFHQKVIKQAERNYGLWLVNIALPALRLAPTVYNAALLHCAGYGTVEKHAFNAHQTEFANRVTNCYFDAKKTDGE